MFKHLKVGDWVTRMLAGVVPMRLKVTEVTDDRIYCGERGVGWEFDPLTGAEIDDDLGWGPPPQRMTGSFLKAEANYDESEA